MSFACDHCPKIEMSSFYDHNLFFIDQNCDIIALYPANAWTEKISKGVHQLESIDHITELNENMLMCWSVATKSVTVLSTATNWANPMGNMHGAYAMQENVGLMQTLAPQGLRLVNSTYTVQQRFSWENKPEVFASGIPKFPNFYLCPVLKQTDENQSVDNYVFGAFLL